MVKQDWYPLEEGRTVGTTGSEGGQILQDEEYIQVARITLEQGHRAPFAITCGIYGWMVHTTFASTAAEALEKFAAMKTRLGEICQLISSRDDVELGAKSPTISHALDTFLREF